MSGGIAGRGRPGPAGPQGPIGPQGPQGEPAFSLAIGQVTAVPYGEEPSAQNVGTTQNQIWDLALPTGATGVLTGSAPPTGTDGTSLGQLYFCTANQTYYGLIELNENDNKWRPLMTQDTAIREYSYDMFVDHHKAEPSDNTRLCGHVHVIFDDVQRTATVAVKFEMDNPVGYASGWTNVVYVDPVIMTRLLADMTAHGITNLIVPVYRQVQGQEATSINMDFGHIRNGAGAQSRMGSLDSYFPPTPGDGSNPGVRVVWQDGKLSYIANTTGAPASTSYGNAPAAPDNADHDTAILALVDGDADYAVQLYASAAAVIPYA